MSSILSSDLLKNIGSFLPNKEKHRISFLGNYEYSVISQIVTYSYNEYIKHNEHNKHNKRLFEQAKWIVQNCKFEMLEDIIKKNINIYSLTF